jgi:hypothetical protein
MAIATPYSVASTAKVADFIRASGLKVAEARAVANKSALADLEPMDDVVDRILRGELHIDDIGARPDLVLLQDTVAMRGQGLVDREADLLGASDRQVKLLRDIWSRELRKIEEGSLPKVWRNRADLHTTRGV